MKNIPIPLLLAFFINTNYCTAQLQDSIFNLCINANPATSANCKNCQAYLKAGFSKAQNDDHVGAIYEYTLAYNAEYSAANDLIYSLINNSATDLEKIKNAAQKNAEELETLNIALKKSEEILKQKNKTITEQRDSIKIAAEEIMHKGKKAEFLRIPVLADSVLQKGNPQEAMALAFYGLSLQVDESYSPSWRVFTEACAASDIVSPMIHLNGETVTALQPLSVDNALIITEKNIYITNNSIKPKRIPTTLRPPFSAILSASKNKMAICAEDGTIELWELARNAAITSFRDYTAKAQLCAFSPDENNVVCFRRRDKLIYRNIKNNQPKELSISSSNVFDIQFNQDGSHFLTRFADGTLGLWDKNGHLHKTIGQEEIYLHDAGFTTDGNNIISANTLGQIKLWNVSKDNPIIIDPSKEAKKNVQIITAEKIIYSAANKIFVRNLKNNKLEDTVSFDNKILGIELNANKTHALVWTAGDHFLYLLDLTKNTINDNFIHHSPISSARFSPNQQWAISTDQNGLTKLWDLNGKLFLEWSTSHSNVPAIVSSSGNYMFLITENGKAIKKCPLPYIQFEKMKLEKQKVMEVLKNNNGYELQYLDSL